MTDREKLREIILVLYNEHNLNQYEIAVLLQLSQTVVSDLMKKRWYALRETKAKHFITRAEEALQYGYIR